MSASMIWQDVQVALFTNLKLDTPFMAACGSRVYESVPQGSLYPLACLLTYSTEDGDKSQPGERIDIEVHGWSQYEGNKELMAIASAAYKALHNKPVMARGATVQTSLLQYLNSTIIPEADGLTKHLVCRFWCRSQSPTQA